MDRPKIEDFKVEYTKGISEIASVIKQYSKSQDLYIDHLEQLRLHSDSKLFYCQWENNGIVKKCDEQCAVCLMVEND